MENGFFFNLFVGAFCVYWSWVTGRIALEMLRKQNLLQKIIGGLLFGAIAILTGTTAMLCAIDLF